MSAVCFVGLGSNLDDPLNQVIRAFDELSGIPNSKLLARSQLYRSDPIGPEGQPDYINAVAKLETDLPPETLLDELQSIEHKHQRKRLIRWGPRTLDLDLLLYGDLLINTERLRVPHPEMAKRPFVLYPLAEIAPELVFPDGTPLDLRLRNCPLGSLEAINIY